MNTARRKRPHLTRYFGLVSVVAMLGLGGVLIALTSHVSRERALDSGAKTAQIVAEYARGAVPLDAHVTGVLTAGQRAAVSEAVSGFKGHLIELRLWTADGGLLYDSPNGSASAFPDGLRLDAATRRGGTDAQLILVLPGQEPGAPPGAGPGERAVLDVYVPLVYGTQTVGAAEVLLDYSDTAAAVTESNRIVAAVIAVGLFMVWLLLHQTVRTFARRLQATSLDNARLALLDPLTGLPNRRMLLDQLARAVRTAQDAGTGVGLVVLDIDRFKDVNDSLGHDMGDELLTQVAQRLQGALRGNDLVARLGGDEFAILVPAISCPQDAEHVANRIRDAFTAAFTLGDMTLHVDSSIGVACLPDHACDQSTLMRTADIAMYAAKVHRLGVAMYSPQEDDSSPSRLVLLGDLHEALTREGELVMHYQPKVSLSTGEMIGAEALMRWQHPTRGMLPPTLFIPLAEQTGLIVDLTRYALEMSIAQIAAWRDAGVAVPVAVNLSAHNLTSSAVVDTIVELLAQHDVPPALLEVEITETALVADPSRIVPVLTSIAEMGISVAIDDFGTGTTSISQLRDLPVSQLKIDRSFIVDMEAAPPEPGAENVVRAMIELAHSFGLLVVAEGVENVQIATRLTELGADHAQGYLYSRPVPATALEQVRVTLLPTPRRGGDASPEQTQPSARTCVRAAGTGGTAL